MNTALSNLPADALVTRAEARPLVGNPSDETLGRWAAAGRFPAPVHGPARRVFYRAGDLRRWLANPSAFQADADSLV